MAIKPGDVVTDLVRGLGKAYFRLRHVPTGVVSEALPREIFLVNKNQLFIELERRVDDKLAGKTELDGLILKPEDVEITLVHGLEGDFVKVSHRPTGVKLEPYPLSEFNLNRRRILEMLNALVFDEMVMEPYSRYFPLGLSPHYWIPYYRKTLWAMSENSFWQASRRKDLHAYRFLYLPSFDAPIMVRLELELGQSFHSLTAKMTNGMGGFEPRELVYKSETSLTTHQTNEFLVKLEAMSFWQSPSHEGDSGIDGSRWMLEGIRDGKYRLKSCWSPEPNDPFRIAAWSLVEMSGLEVERIY